MGGLQLNQIYCCVEFGGKKNLGNYGGVMVTQKWMHLTRLASELPPNPIRATGQSWALHHVQDPHMGV